MLGSAHVRQLRAVISWVTYGVSFIVISALIGLDDAWDTSMAPIAALAVAFCVVGLAFELWIVGRYADDSPPDEDA